MRISDYLFFKYASLVLSVVLIIIGSSLMWEMLSSKFILGIALTALVTLSVAMSIHLLTRNNRIDILSKYLDVFETQNFGESTEEYISGYKAAIKKVKEVIW